MKTIPQDLIRDKIYCVNYIEYLNDAKRTEHCYVAVRQENMADFQEALKTGNFDTDDYGILLEQGLGPAPKFVREKMEMLYGCNHASAIKTNDYRNN